MPAAPVFLEHPSSLQHDTGPHPERADRIRAIVEELEPADFYGFQRVSSPPAERSALTAVHPPSHVDAIEAMAQRGGGQVDFDTVMSARSFEAAQHAAGGAVKLVDLLLDRQVPTGFSAHRPPGHHATQDRAMGFCLFNNVAVAAQHALEDRGVDRVLVFDWDVHHGNGTNDIFHASDGVLFISVHESPLYPGTGPARDIGSGAGTGYTVNLPVPAGSGDDVYRSLVDHVVVPLANSYRPQLMLISAGYDAHYEDPLANCEVSDGGYAAMTVAMRRCSEMLGVPLGCVLEGGYALGALARGVGATMRSLVEPMPELEAVPKAPLAREARARLAQHWPDLGG